MSNYDSDDAYPKSPGLQPIKIKSTPSPSPPPFLPQHSQPVVTQTVSPTTSSSRRRKRNNRTRPSQGDTVLLSFLDPNRPDIARAAGERALNSDSDPEPSDSEDERRTPMPPDETTIRVAQAALRKINGDSHVQPLTTHKLPLARPVATVTEIGPDQDTDMDRTSPKPKTEEQASRKTIEHVAPFLETGLPTPENFSKNGTEGPTPGSTRPDQNSPATSPNLRDLAIPDSQASPDERLPALQNPTSPNRDNSASSPNQRLPSFRQLSEIAEQATQENEHRASFSHRPSISSTGAPALSPTLHSRVPLNGNTRRSPPTQFPPLHPLSPVNSHNSADIKLSPPSNFQLFSSSRRPSTLSDSSSATAFPPPLALTSSSTNDSYGSRGSDAYSPPMRPRSDSHRMSIDGITHPNPAAQIQHVPPHGSTGFKCDYPGCNAAPFQTQYLLNSHANVHSQARPHYCPVPGCSRGEGGKGFKRKNEMIRHGLVHDSPGYVCPFCPERDHKYPRPDNLQRHVRVHHVDKDKDDPQLREVLAQRPEGGGRGRRRRIGS